MNFNPETHHDEFMPKVDRDGREVVKIATGKNTFRYGYRDEMNKGDKEFTGTIVAPEANKPGGWSQ